MFSRRKRLPKDAFQLPGKRLSSPHFAVQVPHAPARGYAVVVSKKTARLAVTRHRLKRRVSEALRSFPLPPALIVYPRASVAALPSKALREELASLVKKARG